MPERALQWATVPKGTQPSRCRADACRAVIYWVERPRMRNGQPVAGQTSRTPIDCSVAGGSEPDSMTDGKGVNHFQTCVAADEF